MRRIAASESAFIYILGLCGGSVLGSVLSNVLPIGSLGGFGIFISYAIPQIAFLLVAFGYSWMRKVDYVGVIHLRKVRNWKQVALLPFISIATIILFLPLSNLFIKLLEAMGYSGGGVYMPVVSNFGIYILALLIMALLPAIGEEFLMRGVLFSGLSTRSTWFGILITSLLFSLMHQNPMQTVHQFGLSIVLCIVLLQSGSIWACVFVHFFNNFISLTITCYIPQIDNWYVSIGNLSYLTDFISIFVGLFLVVGLLYVFYRVGSNKKTSYHSATDGLVYEEFTIFATTEVKKENFKNKFNASLFAQTFRFIGSLFTKRGWMNVTSELRYKCDTPFIGKAQPMFNVWLAIGFAVFYWLIILIMGFI